MINKVFKLVIIILVIIGICFGISITVKKQIPEMKKEESELNIINRVQTRLANVTEIYTYGRALNLSGEVNNISKDNFEGAKLVITDGSEYEEEYTLNYNLDDGKLKFSSDIEINSGIIIDNLENKEYYCLLRLKLNNSADPKYYSFINTSNYGNIEYYTTTKDGKNRKANIEFLKEEINNENYNFLKINLQDTNLPDDIYDIIIDAGHGGKDQGENAGPITEADVTLEYAKSLKESLEKAGYKVKLTRDDENSSTFTETNMYDENGRITIACKSKAKLMISFHINNGVRGLNGFEIYSPSKSNLDFAKEMATKIKEYSSINYSNNNSFKEVDGVYVRNYTKSVIKELESTANKKGYEPYNISLDTPYLYTIREVGGIATGAYVDGRNKAYSKNEYYNSNQGIECYQIELGYIKNDLNIIRNEKESYLRAITEAIENNF